MSAETPIPVAPSLDGTSLPKGRGVVIDRRVLFISVLAMGIGLAAAVVAQVLVRLIGLVTNVAFYGRLSMSVVSPAGNHLGPLVIIVPVIGGILVGIMARYGSRAIRGHGIPEAMEQVLLNESRIPPRITLLKPLSAALAIGTGGPFGAEGPIIATGGALGSFVGQLIKMSSHERKTLLAAGAAAGMAATFGTPLAAVLLAIELLLFEYRPRSLLPVSLATVVAAGARLVWVGPEAVFAMPAIPAPGTEALIAYIIVGLVAGLASVWVTRAVYAVEDGFEKLPIHWMWWPALGSIAVGVVGFVSPRTLGVGYNNIEDAVNGSLAGNALYVLCAWKLVSWTLSLGSGTSGGTLAPLLTVGAGLGAAVGSLFSHFVPDVDPRLAALVGMAALFAGASRALLTSIVFVVEATRQPSGLLPLIGGCSSAFLVSSYLMANSIMTEKISRRGVHVPADYEPDALAVRALAGSPRPIVTLLASSLLEDARAAIEQDSGHRGFPVVDGDGALVGVVTREDLRTRQGARVADVMSTPAVHMDEDGTLRLAADLMKQHGFGRIPIVTRDAPHRVVGITTRSDIVAR